MKAEILDRLLSKQRRDGGFVTHDEGRELSAVLSSGFAQVIRAACRGRPPSESLGPETRR